MNGINKKEFEIKKINLDHLLYHKEFQINNENFKDFLNKLNPNLLNLLQNLIKNDKKEIDFNELSAINCLNFEEYIIVIFLGNFINNIEDKEKIMIKYVDKCYNNFINIDFLNKFRQDKNYFYNISIYEIIIKYFINTGKNNNILWYVSSLFDIVLISHTINYKNFKKMILSIINMLFYILIDNLIIDVLNKNKNINSFFEIIYKFVDYSKYITILNKTFILYKINDFLFSNSLLKEKCEIKADYYKFFEFNENIDIKTNKDLWFFNLYLYINYVTNDNLEYKNIFEINKNQEHINYYVQHLNNFCLIDLLDIEIKINNMLNIVKEEKFPILVFMLNNYFNMNEIINKLTFYFNNKTILFLNIVHYYNLDYNLFISFTSKYKKSELNYDDSDYIIEYLNSITLINNLNEKNAIENMNLFNYENLTNINKSIFKINLGKIYYEIGISKRFRKDKNDFLIKSVSLLKDHIDFYNLELIDIITSSYLRLNMYEESLKFLKQALKINPDNINWLINIIILCFNKNLIEDVFIFLEQFENIFKYSIFLFIFKCYYFILKKELSELNNYFMVDIKNVLNKNIIFNNKDKKKISQLLLKGIKFYIKNFFNINKEEINLLRLSDISDKIDFKLYLFYEKIIYIIMDILCKVKNYRELKIYIDLLDKNISNKSERYYYMAIYELYCNENKEKSLEYLNISLNSNSLNYSTNVLLYELNPVDKEIYLNNLSFVVHESVKNSIKLLNNDYEDNNKIDIYNNIIEFSNYDYFDESILDLKLLM